MMDASRRCLMTWNEGFEAAVALIERTEHSLWVVDHDLCGLMPELGDTPDVLLRCLRRLQPERMCILLRDIAPLLNQMPKMRRHLVDYGHIASVRQVAAHHAPMIDRSLLISDDRHVLVRPRHDQARAFFSEDDPASAATEQPQLETIWSAASNANIGAVLGL